jgi:hypothetical protein
MADRSARPHPIGHPPHAVHLEVVGDFAEFCGRQSLAELSILNPLFGKIIEGRARIS